MTMVQVAEGLTPALLEASPDCVKVLDLAGRVAFVNPAGLERMAIPSLDDVLDSPWEEFWPPCTRAMVRAAVAEAVGGGVARFVAECPTRAGSSRWWDVTVSPVREGNSVSRVLAVSRDITEARRAELALREAEERQRLLLEAAQEGICTVDRAGIVTYANPRLGELLGEPSANLMGRSIFECIAPTAVDAARARFARRTEGTPVPSEDVPLTRTDGTSVWLRIAAGTLPAPDGGFGGAVYLASDVTAEHAAKDELARSERYFRALIERASEMVAVLSPDGCILYATPAWLELLGYTPDEVVGMNAMTLIHPDSRARVIATLQQVAAVPGASATVEYRVIHKDGSTRIFHSVGHNLLDDEAVRGIVVNSHDVTERRVAEEQRQQQTELLERIFEHIPAMITFYGADGKPLFANAEWERVTGWPRSERATTPIFEHLFPDPTLRASVRAFIEAAVPGEWREWVMHTRDGRTRDTAWTNLRLSDGSIVCLGRDITEERRLAAQLRQSQKMEAVGQLTAGIAHDFNNLLQVITGNAYFAREGVPADSGAAEDLVQIQAAAERAASLTRQLLAFSRQQVLHPAPVELDDIVAGMESMLERTLGEHIALATQLEGGIVINADRHQIEQVIMNLAVNARDAMPDGGVLLIETRRMHVDHEGANVPAPLVPGEYAALVVRDTGTGMDAATRARIFEPFFTTKPLGVGTGLGLSMVHGIVHQSGGSISVESNPGIGSAFTVLLPCVDAAETPRVHDVSLVPGGAAETVLLAEDDAAVRATVRRLLDEAGYTVIEAKNGGEAVARLDEDAEHAIQLLVTDAVMPDAGARDVIEIGQRIRPSLPILVISGHSAELVDPDGELGVDVLAKPFTSEQLLRRVRAAIDRARTRG